MIKKAIILFFFLIFTLSFFSSGLVDSQDGLQYLAVARNIYYKSEPTSPTYEYGKENGWKNVYMNTYVGRNGKTYGLTGLGFSLAMVPSVAITDIFYKIYNITPTFHFPLENDWLILLTTSFVNIFFASLMSGIMFLYLQEFRIKSKTSLLITLLAIFTTNLFAFSKHITAHMMFSTFLFTTLFLLKKFSNTPKRIFLYFAGVSFGIMMVTYNNTFLLTIPAILLYYILLMKPKFNLDSLKTGLKNLAIFMLGVLPFVAIYYWFENLRAPQDVVLSSSSFLLSFAKDRILKVPFTVFFEGLWGQLFSPGRSIFIYSPLLLTIILFWFKFKKIILPEVFLFLLLSATYIIFYSTLFSVGAPEQGYVGLWHGESSWGPRYLAPLIAPGMILVGYIYQQLKKFQKILVILPLSIIGLYIEILGITMPYQTKFNSLQKNFFINNTEYNLYVYSDLLPRYTPIIIMTKNLVRLERNLKNLINPGIYSVKMYDGINFPFDVGPERWRRIEKTGYISFDNEDTNPIKNISFDIINHPISDTKVPLVINFELNGKEALPKPVTLKIGERKNISLDLSKSEILNKGNSLIVTAKYAGDEEVINEKQIPALINMYINGKAVNKEYIWVPYVSSLGPKMTGVEYQNWGGTNPSPWSLWDLHTQTFERFPDFWWFRNMFYWDIPHKPFIALLIIDISGIIYFAYNLKKII